MGKLIFLDFDGVLRKVTSSPSRLAPDCLHHFESTVRQCDKSKIVISSTWRLAIPLKGLRSLFSPDIAARIVGVTPEILEAETYERYAEIKAFLASKNLNALPWVAIDDDPSYFPKGSPVLLVDPQNGFDANSALQLLSLLKGFDLPPAFRTR